jgi:hypothetical protein
MIVRVPLVAGALLAAAALTVPAFANHEPDYAERVRNCATQSYALVESIITFRESIAVVAEATGTLPTATDQRIMATVARATSAGAGRMFDNLSDCLIGLRDGIAPGVEANLAAQGIAVEIDFAVEEVNGIFATVDQVEAALRAKWGAAGTAQAATALQPFRDFAFDLEGYLEEARAFVAILVDRTTPDAAPPAVPRPVPPPVPPPGGAPPAAPRTPL